MAPTCTCSSGPNCSGSGATLGHEIAGWTDNGTIGLCAVAVAKALGCRVDLAARHEVQRAAGAIKVELQP